MAAPVRVVSFHQVPVLSLDLKLSDLGSSPMATPLLSAPCLGQDSLGNISMPPAYYCSLLEDPSLPLFLPHMPIQLQLNKQELYNLVSQSSKQLIEDKINMYHYFGHFWILSGPLLSSGYVSDTECNELFWQGFHPNDHAILLPYLVDKCPNQWPGADFNFKELFGLAHIFISHRRPAARAKAEAKAMR